MCAAPRNPDTSPTGMKWLTRIKIITFTRKTITAATRTGLPAAVTRLQIFEWRLQSASASTRRS
jgi:hypothetical protein